jgi:hypothetical protein
VLSRQVDRTISCRGLPIERAKLSVARGGRAVHGAGFGLETCVHRPVAPRLIEPLDSVLRLGGPIACELPGPIGYTIDSALAGPIGSIGGSVGGTFTGESCGVFVPGTEVPVTNAPVADGDLRAQRTGGEAECQDGGKGQPLEAHGRGLLFGCVPESDTNMSEFVGQAVRDGLTNSERELVEDGFQ